MTSERKEIKLEVFHSLNFILLTDMTVNFFLPQILPEGGSFK